MLRPAQVVFLALNRLFSLISAADYNSGPLHLRMPAPNTFTQSTPSVLRTKERSMYRNLDNVLHLNTSFDVEEPLRSLLACRLMHNPDSTVSTPIQMFIAKSRQNPRVTFFMSAHSLLISKYFAVQIISHPQNSGKQ